MTKGKTISTPISDEEVEVVVYKFIENFEKEREKQGLFQQDIENLTGISQQAISRIEKHKNSIIKEIIFFGGSVIFSIILRSFSKTQSFSVDQQS